MVDKSVILFDDAYADFRADIDRMHHRGEGVDEIGRGRPLLVIVVPEESVELQLALIAIRHIISQSRFKVDESRSARKPLRAVNTSDKQPILRQQSQFQFDRCWSRCRSG